MDKKIYRRSFLGGLSIFITGCIGNNNSVSSENRNILDFPTKEEVLPRTFPPSRLKDKAVSGGVGKDAIPSIDNPIFIDPNKANEFLKDENIVFGVNIGETKKAYPRSILVSHEICNDQIDGIPVSITYCPLTGTALGFKRGNTTFGVSGHLINNNLIMYDRSTESWWPQILATSIESPWNQRYFSSSLQEINVVWTTWKKWKQKHPDTKVLSRETGFIRNYNRDPYGSYIPNKTGYYSLNSPPLYKPLKNDDRHPPKKVFIGARNPEGSVVFSKESLRQKKYMDGSIGKTSILAVYDDRLDTAYVYENKNKISFSYKKEWFVRDNGNRYRPHLLPLKRIISFDVM